MAHDPDKDPKLTGMIEADETYVGGKPRYRAGRMPTGQKRGFRPNQARHGRALGTKVPVFAVVQRGGEVRTRVIPRVTGENLTKALLDHTDMSAEEVARSALQIAGELCIYTNDNITLYTIATEDKETNDE